MHVVVVVTGNVVVGTVVVVVVGTVVVVLVDVVVVVLVVVLVDVVVVGTVVHLTSRLHWQLVFVESPSTATIMSDADVPAQLTTGVLLPE